MSSVEKKEGMNRHQKGKNIGIKKKSPSTFRFQDFYTELLRMILNYVIMY